jgi:hypothetical protein
MSDSYKSAGYCIYDHPADYPNAFVVRQWFMLPGGNVVPDKRFILADTLENARSCIPDGCICFERSENDDPKIVETWL